MNVKIKNKNLRFKITDDELNVLLSGHAVHEKVELFDKTLVIIINPNGRGEAMEPKLVLDEREAYLNLCIPQAQLQALSDLCPDREGITQKTGDISVTLQVDMPEACHA